MATKVVSLEKFADEMKAYNKKSMVKYKKAIIDALLKSIPRLVKQSPVDTGLFAQSWDLIVTEKSAIIGNYAPHAAVIEFGARPFTPPIGPLLAWAKRVLKQSEINDACWALARYTQNKIAEEGMKPRFILTNSLDSIMEDVRMNMKREFERG